MRNALLIVVCLAAIGLAPAVSADTSGPFTSNTIGYQATDWSGSLLLPKFNSSLGILDEIDLLISGAIKTTLTVENTGTSNSTGDAFTESQITVTDPLTLLTLVVDLNSPNFHFEDLVPNNSISSGELTKTGAAFDSYTDSAILSEFTGSGNISLPASTFTRAWITYTGGNAAAEQTTDARAYARVTYYYHTVPETPEPSSLLALFTGICGVAGLIYRRK